MGNSVELLRDEMLGELRWNDTLDWWEGEFYINANHPVSLSLTPDEDDDSDDEDDESSPGASGDTANRAPAHLLAAAKALVTLLRDPGAEESLRRTAGEKLVPQHATTWAREGQPPQTAETIAERLLLEDVNLNGDGSAELFYDDGGLFEGHAVLITVDETGEVADAKIGG